MGMLVFLFLSWPIRPTDKIYNGKVVVDQKHVQEVLFG